VLCFDDGPFFVCFVIFYVFSYSPNPPRPFPLENKWWLGNGIECNVNVKIPFTFLLNFHLTPLLKNSQKWNLCVDIYSHADFHPPPSSCIATEEISYISSFLLRAHAHKIIHNTIWYLLPVCTNIMLDDGKLTSLKCLRVIRTAATKLSRAVVSTFFLLFHNPLFLSPSLTFCLFNPKNRLQIE
jgi:hypothetical protein